MVQNFVGVMELFENLLKGKKLRVPIPGRMSSMRLLVLLLLPLSLAAPKDGIMRLDPEMQQQPLPNPFQPGQEQLRLLQSYLKGLERMEEEPEHMSREQVLLYLFALHDYDQSGQLDGLELLSMLTAALALGAADSPTTNPVILIVDKVLETQDLNGDGLMTPAELISFPGQPLELQDVGRQSLVTESSPRQEAQEALGPKEEAGGQVEARGEFLEPVQEAEGQAEAGGEAPGPGGEAEGQAEAGGEAPGPGREAGGQAEAGGEAPGPGGEAEGQAEAGGEAPGPGGEAEGQAEAGGEAPGPGREAGGQAEARDTREEVKELPGETMEFKNAPNGFEVHAIQMENDEI